MRGRLLCLAVLAVLVLALVTVGAAQEISISSEQKDYYIEQNSQANLPLVLTNTYGHDVTGTLERTSLSGTDPAGSGSAPSSAVQSASFRIPAGSHSINLHLGPYDDPATTQMVTLRYTYTEGGVTRAVTLPPLVVHVTTEDPAALNANAKSHLASTDQPAPPTTAQADSQGQGQSQSQSMEQALQSGQMPGDAGALQTQFRQEENLTVHRQTALGQVIEHDPTVQAIVASLQAQGFAEDDRQVTPVSNVTGQFRYHFAKKSGEEATLNGGMDNATLVFADQQSAASIALPPLLAENATFKTFAGKLPGDGFTHVQTDINTTLNNSSAVSVLWTDRDKNPATASALVQNNTTLTGLTLHRPAPVPSNLIPFLLSLLRPIVLTLLGVLCIVGGFVLYRRRRKNAGATDPARPPFDYVKAARALLDQAVALHGDGLDREAYAAAGQALRLLLSYHYGDGTSSTDQEVLALLARRGTEDQKVREILATCSLVEFAKRTPAAGEFDAIRAAVAARIGIVEAEKRVNQLN